MTDPATSLAMRQMRAHLGAPVVLVAQVGVALLLGLSGPFGTLEGMAAALRFPYWAGIVFGTYALGTAIAVLVTDRLDRGSRWPLTLRALRAGAVIGLAVLAFLALWNLLFFGPGGMLAPFRPSVLGGTMLVSVLIMGLRALWPAPAATPLSGAHGTPPLMRRLPLQKRGALVALTATDHYVEVITTKGRDLILMRLADAIAEAAPVRGLQVHRSHWVALDRVRGVQRRGDGAILEMDTGNTSEGNTSEGTAGEGLAIPVSRRHMAAIRDAGLLPAKPG